MRAYRKLRALLFEKELTQQHLAKKLGRSKAYMSDRFSGKMPFDLDEAYSICDLLGLEYNQIPEYFPKGGNQRNA